MDEELKSRPLFGDAIRIHIPERFVDISDFRPIPDHQEVFADANVDQSFIIDIMVSKHCTFSSKRYVNDCFHFSTSPSHLTIPFWHCSFSTQTIEPSKEYANVPDEQAAEFHFEDQCREGDANAFKVDSVRKLANAEVPLLLLHEQNTSRVTPCWLLSGQMTAGKGRQSALNKIQLLMCLVRIPEKTTDVLLTLNTPIFIAAESAAAQTAGSGHQSAYIDAPRLFSRIIASLHILNWDLFG